MALIADIFLSLVFDKHLFFVAFFVYLAFFFKDDLFGAEHRLFAVWAVGTGFGAAPHWSYCAWLFSHVGWHLTKIFQLFWIHRTRIIELKSITKIILDRHQLWSLYLNFLLKYCIDIHDAYFFVTELLVFLDEMLKLVLGEVELSLLLFGSILKLRSKKPSLFQIRKKFIILQFEHYSISQQFFLSLHTFFI